MEGDAESLANVHDQEVLRRVEMIVGVPCQSSHQGFYAEMFMQTERPIKTLPQSASDRYIQAPPEPRLPQ